MDDGNRTHVTGLESNLRYTVIISTTANADNTISLKNYILHIKSVIVIENILKIDIHEEVTSSNAAIAHLLYYLR